MTVHEIAGLIFACVGAFTAITTTCVLAFWAVRAVVKGIN